MKTLNQKSKIEGSNRLHSLSSLHNETGAVLIVALLLMIVMISLVPVAVKMTSGDNIRTRNYQESRKAFFIADAGVEHAKSVASGFTDMNDLLDGADNDSLNTSDNGLFSSISGGTQATYSLNGTTHDYTKVALNDANSNYIGDYYVRVQDNNDEGTATNDPWVDTDGVVVLESVGVSPDGSVKAIQAMVQRFLLVPKLPAAVTLVGPLSTINSQGSGFAVEGGKQDSGTITHGYDLNGNADTNCAAKNAISTESGGPTQFVPNISMCTDATCAEFGGGAENKIKGVSNTTPDISNGQTDFSAQDAEDLHDLLTQAGTPDHSWSGASTLSGTTTYGDASNPEVLYFDDSATISGNITGTGILIVDGDLDITGSLDWDGIILVGACATCNGALVGTGSASVDGAMVVGNSVDAAVNFTGSADIHYSCQGIALANNVFGSSLTVASWKEVK
jgi:hypothetical protein